MENVVIEKGRIHLTRVHHLTEHTCVLKYSTLARAHTFFSLSSAFWDCAPRVHAHIKTHAFCSVCLRSCVFLLSEFVYINHFLMHFPEVIWSEEML